MPNCRGSSRGKVHGQGGKMKPLNDPWVGRRHNPYVRNRIINALIPICALKHLSLLPPADALCSDRHGLLVNVARVSWLMSRLVLMSQGVIRAPGDA